MCNQLFNCSSPPSRKETKTGLGTSVHNACRWPCPRWGHRHQVNHASRNTLWSWPALELWADCHIPLTGAPESIWSGGFQVCSVNTCYVLIVLYSHCVCLLSVAFALFLCVCVSFMFVCLCLGAVDTVQTLASAASRGLIPWMRTVIWTWLRMDKKMCTSRGNLAISLI